MAKKNEGKEMSIISDLRKKAVNGGPEWARYLGSCLLAGEYETGAGEVRRIRKNEEEALYWLRQAADGGDAGAMIELGAYYGNLANHDRSCFVQALFWEKKAWQAKCEVAGQNIAVTYSMMGKRRLSHQWLKRGYERCKWSTRFSLAKTFLCGYGVRRDVPMAKRLFLEVIGDRRSHPQHKALARKYLRIIRRGDKPDGKVIYP